MAVTNNEFKACFCDGSCKESGFCGGDMSDLVHRYPYRVDSGILNPSLEIPMPKKKAQELKEKAKAAQEKHRVEQRQKAQALYQTLLPKFEKVAADGGTKYLVSDSLLRECDLSVFNKLMTEEGFVTSNANGGIYVRWDDEPLFNIR